MSRLILRYVDVQTLATVQYAVVKLELAGKIFTGRFRLRGGENLPEAVARATLSAINEAIYSRVNAKIDFKLHHTQELQPPFLNRSLFVVVLDASFGHLVFRLVGAVVGDTQDWPRASASSVLDAVNRLVQRILELEGSV